MKPSNRHPALWRERPRNYAVIDLGSNSFRLELVRPEPQGVRRLAYFKDTVRLGGGLNADGQLSAEAMQTAFASLERFAQILQRNRLAGRRAIATQTLREAGNRAVFLQEAERILGCPIDLISGEEEARLIYLGVTARMADKTERRLVIDIGGRSTEIISGQGKKAKNLASYALGSVAVSQQFFADGEFTRASLQAAHAHALAVLEPAQALFPPQDWAVAYGSAGTTSAVSAILQASGYGGDVLTLDGLAWLREQLLLAGRAQDLKLPGLKADRRAVIGGGFSVLAALFEALQMQELRIVSGALRHGVLQELLPQRPHKAK